MQGGCARARFELLESARKLSLVLLPLFFRPGSMGQARGSADESGERSIDAAFDSRSACS